MIQHRTMLKVVDNSGAKVLQCIKVLGGTRRRYAYIGDIIVGTIKEAEPRKLVKKHDIIRAVIIRQKKALRRPDGSYVRFDDNAGVAIDNINSKNPLGTRVFGPVAREIKEKGFNKIASLAKEVL